MISGIQGFYGGYKDIWGRGGHRVWSFFVGGRFEASIESRTLSPKPPKKKP